MVRFLWLSGIAGRFDSCFDYKLNEFNTTKQRKLDKETDRTSDVTYQLDERHGSRLAHLCHFDLVEVDVHAGKTLRKRLERDLVVFEETKYRLQVALVEHDCSIHEISGKVKVGDGRIEADHLALVRTQLGAS